MNSIAEYANTVGNGVGEVKFCSANSRIDGEHSGVGFLEICEDSCLTYVLFSEMSPFHIACAL